MKLHIAVTKALVLAVGFALCGAPELLHAWQQPAQPQSEAPKWGPTRTMTPTAPGGTAATPSAAAASGRRSPHSRVANSHSARGVSNSHARVAGCLLKR